MRYGSNDPLLYSLCGRGLLKPVDADWLAIQSRRARAPEQHRPITRRQFLNASLPALTGEPETALQPISICGHLRGCVLSTALARTLSSAYARITGSLLAR